jgi:tetratricopeptide (TPR) repeat protein
LSISRQIGCRKNIAAALKNLALLEASQNQLQDADRNLAEAASIAGEIGDKEQLLSLQIGRGSGLFTLGEYDSAKEVFETALNAARDTNNRREVAYTSQWLGFILYYLGNLAEADRNLRRAIDIAQHSDFQDIRADSGSDLGDVLLARGDKAGARRQYQDALELSVKREEQSSVASSRLSLASLSLEEGNPREAESLARQAAEEFQKEKDVDSEASARDTLARALLAQGKLQDAEAEIGSAISLAPEERTVRMSLAVTAAMDKSRAGKTAEAKESLDNSLLEAKRMKLLGFQLEIRLAQAEIEATSDRGAARLHLQSLERDASESEFLLIAAKAKRVAGTLDK